MEPKDEWSNQPGALGCRNDMDNRTTGITGLWQPSVHSDVAFWSFDVGSSYHTEAEFGKRWIVHPLNVFQTDLVGIAMLFNVSILEMDNR